ncbi:MAG: O-antigen ligase family protein [Acidobacteria bacterium]|nr:O-antigen ligase family protein [Acidobacteriota bacterium]
MTTSVEAATKIATVASAILIVSVQLGVNPDATWALRTIGSFMFVAGWLSGRFSRQWFPALWVAGAVLAPAVLRLFAQREGPVLDLAWMAGAVGYLARTVPWSRWNLPPWWRLLLGGWGLTLALAWPVIGGREIAFDVDLLADAGAINSWALLSASQAVSWTLYVVVVQLVGLLWLDWIVGSFREDSDRLPSLIHGLWIGTTIASLVAIYQGLVDPTFLSTSPWASLDRATGTMLDANAYGMSASIAGAVGFVVLRWQRRRCALPAAFGVLAINWVGMGMSGSRTALLCALPATLPMAIELWRSRGQTGRARLAITAVAVLAAIGWAGAVGPVRRMLDLQLSGGQAIQTLWNRGGAGVQGGYGTIANQMVREYPLTGVGPGSYHIIAPDYWRLMTDNRLQFDNAQNWWRHQAAEFGLLGGVLIFIWSGIVAWAVLTSRVRPDRSGAGAIIRWTIVGIGATSIFGVPTQSPALLLWLFALVAWLTVAWRDARRPTAEEERSVPLALWLVATGLALGYSAAHLMYARGSLAVAERARRAHHQYVVGAHPPELLPAGSQFRWTRGKETRVVWPATTRWPVIVLWVDHPDIVVEPVRVTLTTPCGVLLDESLRTHEPVKVGLELPEGQQTVEASLHVSRTWRPAAYGISDPRELGVAFVIGFVDTRDDLVSTRTVAWPACAPRVRSSRRSSGPEGLRHVRSYWPV